MLETRPSSLPQVGVRLRDGRRLAYVEYGDPEGRPVLFFHGTPGSRLFHHPDGSIAAAAGARIIAIDRPGFGRSDFKPGRKLLEWPDDVLQLAGSLKLTSFAVLGYSSGGAYAAACALRIPDRLTGIGLVSSVAPIMNPEMAKGMHGLGRVFLNLNRRLSPLARVGTGLICNLWRDNPEAYFKSQLEGLRESQAARAALPRIKAMLTADLREAIRNGTDGVTFELKLLSQPWGFQPGAIKPAVLLWHGENDTETPVAMGRHLAGAIPHCRASFFPREGHWTIYVHWREILTALLANAGPVPDAVPLSELACAPLSISTLSGSADSGQGLPPAPPAGDPAPAIDAVEPAPEATSAAAETPAPPPEATIPPAGEAPAAPARKKTVRRGKAPLPGAHRGKKGRPAPEKKGRTAGKPPSRPVSGGPRRRTSGEAGARAASGKPPAKKPAKRAAEPAARRTPGETQAPPDPGAPPPGKASSGHGSSREPVRV